MNYLELMEKARHANKERDDIDGGFARPDANPIILLRTAMSAIECGITLEDWNCVAEGQAMLEQLQHFGV